jgi:hypothetical protein
MSEVADVLSLPNLLTVSQFSQKRPAFKEAGVRWLIFHAATNGLGQSGAIVRLGRRVLIDEAKFVSWVVTGGATVSRNTDRSWR